MPHTFQSKASDIISKARRMTNDAMAPYRTSDSDALGCLNDALNALLMVRPGLFSSTGTHTTTAGAEQMLANTRAVELVEVQAGTEADRQTLNQFKPAWRSMAAGSLVNWMRVPGEPLRFDVYPPALANVTLPVRFIASPVPLVALTDLMPVSENYDQALVEYVVGRIEMQDDEHVNSTRAAQLMTRFAEQVKGVA